MMLLLLLQDALTTRPPQVLLMPHPSFDVNKLSTLIERLEVRFAASDLHSRMKIPCSLLPSAFSVRLYSVLLWDTCQATS